MNTSSYGQVCPSCGKAKLSITVTDQGTLFNCFSASCDNRGIRLPEGVIPSPTQRSQRKPGNPFDGELISLPHEQMSALMNEVGFTDEHISIARPMWCAKMQRVAYPLLTPLGTRQGFCLRAYDGRTTPKALTYVDADSSKLGYYHRHKSRTAIIVEDIPSAIRASLYCNSVALLGTSMGQDERHELSLYYDKLIIALDFDAGAQAIRLQASLRCLFKEVDVLLLPMDLKDMEEEELCQLLQPLS